MEKKVQGKQGKWLAVKTSLLDAMVLNHFLHNLDSNVDFGVLFNPNLGSVSSNI